LKNKHDINNKWHLAKVVNLFRHLSVTRHTTATSFVKSPATFNSCWRREEREEREKRRDNFLCLHLPCQAQLLKMTTN